MTPPSKPGIDVSAISSSKPDDIKPSANALAEQEQLAHAQKTFENELGWLGKAFGGRTEKPGNISGLVIVVCFSLLIIVLMSDFEEEKFGMNASDLITIIVGIITLTLGYLFGSNTKD